MACASSYVTADEVAEFFCRSEGYGAASEPTLGDIERYIAKGAARINQSIAAVGACGCSFNTWAADFLQELNLIAAVLLIHCPDCSRKFNQEQKEFYAGWLSEQLELIRTGKLELCDGYTGVEYPSITWAEQAMTDWQAARIVVNDALRNSS